MNDVREVQDRFDQAERTADLDTLRELISEDFLSIGPRGFVLDKQQWIDRHREFTYHALDTSEMDVRRYGDTAVVRDVQRNRATWRDQQVQVATRVSQVWVRRADRWQLVAIQFSPLADAPPADAPPAEAPPAEAAPSEAPPPERSPR
jgi:ketosteroid isomerase-like protein